MRYLNFVFLAILVLSNAIFIVDGVHLNYKDALSKSIIFLEAQRSGKLPRNNRVKWRGDSGLDDGKLAGVDLVGGYYDAGDNVKYGLPMAFTITSLAWTAISYKAELKATGELENVHAAIRWGTDFFLKAAKKKNQLWVQVGDPVADHQCWVRPENMRTPRTLYKISQSEPGTEIAAETAAALAAASIVFKEDHAYSRRLLNRAKLLFDFAKNHKGTYDGECPFYCSYSGFQDELLWGGTWLYLATKKSQYFKYVTEEAITSSANEFSWDLKSAGAQLLLSEMHLTGEHGAQSFKEQIDHFVCAVMPGTSYQQVYQTPGGMIHLRDGANTQYVTGTAFILFLYSNILKEHHEFADCGKGVRFSGDNLRQFAKQQMDYLLGSNPNKRSYMAGFGVNPPTQPHHRGASTPVLHINTVVDCAMSFTQWFQRDAPNYNVLTGAIVGGPDKNDNFEDKRSQSSMLEPTTYINSLAIGPLLELAVHGK